MSKVLKKADLVLIAQKRNPGTASSKWSKLKIAELKKLLLPLTPEEKKYIAKHKAKQADLPKLDNETIKKTILLATNSKAAKLTKSAKIELIVKNNFKIYKPPIFNED